MRGRKLTLRLVAALGAHKADYFVWDSEVAGFGLKITPTGHKTYVLQYRHEGRSRRYAIGPNGSPWTVETARAEARRLLGQVVTKVDVQSEKIEHRSDPTVAELCDLYLELGLATRKASSREAARSDFENHVKPRLGNRKATSIIRADIEKLLVDIANGETARRSKGAKKRSLSRVRGGKGAANSVVRTLSAAFGYGVANGVRADNPCAGVTKYTERKLNRFLSPEELVRLGEALQAAEAVGVENPYTIAAIRLLVMTGCRRNEILELERRCIDYPNRCLRLLDSKTGAKVVHVGAAVMDLLRDIPVVEGNPYVLPGPGREGRLVNIQKPWDRLRKAAGLEEVRIHDLRHSFASFGANAGDSLLVIGALLGHRSAKSTERYAHLAAGPVKHAAQRISGDIAELLGRPPACSEEVTDFAALTTAEIEPVRTLLGEVVKARWLDTIAVSARLGLTVKTLQTYRWLGVGPPFQKIGKRVVYSEVLVDRWRGTPAAKALATAE